MQISKKVSLLALPLAFVFAMAFGGSAEAASWNSLGYWDKLTSNPYGCNLNTQYLRDDNGQCIDRVSSPTQSTQTISTNVSSTDPNGCEPQRFWAAESPHYCIDKSTGSVASAVAPVAAQPAAAPAPAPRPVASGCSAVYAYSNWNQAVAYAVCMAESGGNSNAYNPEYHPAGCYGSRGLFQIGCSHGANSTFDPASNVAYANRLYSESGWQPWGAYTSGAYYRFL